MELWKQKAPPGQVVSPRTTVLVSGSFLKVLKIGVLEVEVSFLKDSSRTSKKLEWEFSIANLEQVVDEVSSTIGQWIDPDFTLTKHPFSPLYNDSLTQKVYRFKALSLSNETFPEALDVLALRDLVTEKTSPDLLAVVIQAMLEFATTLPEKEQKAYYKEIEVFLRMSLREHPKASQLHALLAECYYLMEGYPEWVEKEGLEALKYDPESDLGQLMVVLSEKNSKKEYHQKRQKLKSINPWLWPLSKKDNYQFQHGILTNFLLTTPHFDSEQDEDGATVLLEEAKELLKQEKVEESFAILGQVIEDYPEIIDPFLIKANFYAKKKQWKKSNQILLPLEKKYSNSVPFLYQIGENYYYLKQYILAENHFFQVLSIKPDHPSSLMRLANTLIQQKRSEDAIKHINTLLAIDSKNSGYWWLKGLANWHLKNWDETVKAWKKSAELSPNNKNLIQWLKRAKQRADKS